MQVSFETLIFREIELKEGVGLDFFKCLNKEVLLFLTKLVNHPNDRSMYFSSLNNSSFEKDGRSVLLPACH